jgi:integrase
MREPWWRQQNGHWYVKHFGKQHRLSKEPDPDGGGRKNPPAAVVTAWHKLLAEDEPMRRHENLTMRQVFDPFRELCKSEPKKCTDWILSRFQKFVGPDFPVSKLIPNHLTKFFEKNPQWGPSTRRTMVNRVLAAINHAVEEGLIEKNPISSTPNFKRSKYGHHSKRKGTVPAELRQRLEAGAIPALRAILVSLRESGCRPAELRRARVERCFLAQNVLYVPNKTARKTGEPERKIYLSEEMKGLLKGLIGDRTEGFIFLTAKGKHWTYDNLQERWRKLVAKVPVPKGVTLYTYRRTFISEAINKKNVNPALVAQLAGHTDLTMLLKHYLEEDPAALKRAVEEVTRKDGPPPLGTP